MKFFISDKTKTTNKFSKWWFWHDESCKIITQDDYIVLYYGYAIGESLKEKILNDWQNLHELNGSFCCCKITKDTIEVINDYFDTSKIFYSYKNGIEVSNSLKLLSIDKKDIDMAEVGRRQKIPNNRDDSFNGTWHLYHPFSSHEYQFRERCPSACKTVFKSIFQLQSQHKLIVGNRIYQKRLHNINQDIQRMLGSGSNFKTVDELQNYIAEKMKIHADTIKKNYKNVVCTLSEGIDSVLQSVHFPETKQYSYHVINPEGVNVEYKTKLFRDLNFKDIVIKKFDCKTAIESAKKYATDPTAYYYDWLPLYPLIKDADSKPDVVLLGSNADEMFMHREGYLASQVYELMHRKDPRTASANTRKWFHDNSACYSTRSTINQDKTDLQTLLADEDNDNYWHSCPNHFIESISLRLSCGLYSRQLSHEFDTEVTSLYQDKSICFEIMKFPLEQRIEIAKDCIVQKSILKDNFDINFTTPYKDNASYNTNAPVSKWYTITLPYVLQNHLPKA